MPGVARGRWPNCRNARTETVATRGWFNREIGRRRRSENVEDARGFGGGPNWPVAASGGHRRGDRVAHGCRSESAVAATPTSSTVAPSSGPVSSPEEDKLKDFVSAVLASHGGHVGRMFKAGGRQYVDPKLVLFSGAVQSACGFAQAAVGPFYARPTRRSTSTWLLSRSARALPRARSFAEAT